MSRLLRIAFWAAALFAFVMATLPAPPNLQVSDKLQHMTAFFVIALLGCAAFPRLSRLKLLLALIAFGGFIELVQMVPALHRDSEWGDWFADIAAASLALVVAALSARLRSARTD
jgi:hypothetical protein